MITITDLAAEIVEELADETVTITVVSYWIRANIGKLNNLLDTDYEIGNDLEISPILGEEEAAVYKLLYLIKYYDVRIRANLGASGIETLLEVSSDGGVIKRASRSQIALEYRKLREATVNDLKEQVQSYHLNQIRPLSVDGVDTESGDTNINYDVYTRINRSLNTWQGL